MTDAHDIVLGDFVETTTHKYRGRVTDVHHWCPESDAWLAGQQPEPLTHRKMDRWISVLVHDGGSVVVPDDLARRIEPFEFRNPWASFYFREVSE